MIWYHAFLSALIVVWLGATARDRSAVRIILGATVLSELLVGCVTCHISGAWKLVVPGTVEVGTIACLLFWARNTTGFCNAGLLAFAWLAHFVCYVDVVCGTDLVYSRYESVLAGIAALQLLTFHDTIRYLLSCVVSWPRVRAARVAVLRPTSVRASVLSRSRP